jgi:LysM repeat protein
LNKTHVRVIIFSKVRTNVWRMIFMLKYSTYRSIYDKAPVVESLGHNSVSRNSAQLKEIAERSLEGILRIFRGDFFMKLTLIVVLVLGGLTVVSNAFAGSTIIMKQEKRIVVERGDTLWSIALKNKPADMRTVVYIEGIKQSSGIKSSQIKAGDVLTLPIY